MSERDDTADEDWEEADDGNWYGDRTQRREAAKTIAHTVADPPPDWLVETIATTALVKLSTEVAVAAFHSVERRTIVKTIEQGLEGYAALWVMICDPYVGTHIYNYWSNDLPRGAFEEFTMALLQFGPAAKQMLERMAAELRGRSGPGRLTAEIHGQSPEWFCAAFAMTIWQAVRPEPLRPGSKRLHRLCAALWQAVGRTEQPDWRYHISTVLSYLSEDDSGDRNPARSEARWEFQSFERNFKQTAMFYRRQHDGTG